MRAREQIERILGRMDLVQREEFEAVKAMAAKAREEQELLSQRLAELEKQLKTARKQTPPSA
jgi:BMFP domain-containing protein YqiC